MNHARKVLSFQKLTEGPNSKTTLHEVKSRRYRGTVCKNHVPKSSTKDHLKKKRLQLQKNRDKWKEARAPGHQGAGIHGGPAGSVVDTNWFCPEPDPTFQVVQDPDTDPTLYTRPNN